MSALKEIIREIEAFAPLKLQEDWDNSGLQIGDPEQEIHAVLLTLDITEAVMDEAIALKCNLIISHHPLLFHSLKKINYQNAHERLVFKAIQNHIAVYAAHTNLDAVQGGVNTCMAQTLKLEQIKILQPLKSYLFKLIVMIPEKFAAQVSQSMYEAGAGHMGKYDHCGFHAEGTGTFRGLEGSRPFVGEINKLREDPEVRFETLVPGHALDQVIRAMIENHPYEKPSYDIISLANEYEDAGSGAIGVLPKPVSELDFLIRLKYLFNLQIIRHTPLTGKKICKVAVCGGSGSAYTEHAIACGADAMVSADFKYHDFIAAENRILIADIGHYESEVHTKEIFHKLLTKKKPNFAIYVSKINTNSINHLI